MNCIPCGPTQTGAPFNPDREIIITTDEETRTFDFLVIACDPQDGLTEEVMKKTKKEKKVFSTDVMKSFVIQTTLIKVPKVALDKPIEVFNPVALQEMKGLMHSYRSETRKEALEITYKSKNSNPTKFFEDQMSKVQYEYVTVYQLLDPEKHGKLSQYQLWAKLKEELKRGMNDWFPYQWEEGPDGSENYEKQFNTKYFDHFTRDALKNKPNNWNILDIQGKKNTIYVHASTAFESVLHIYKYIELLKNNCQSSFPFDKQSRIAIIGAGPSGLLISRKLAQQMGYTDITMFETKENESELHAGKTQTNLLSQLDDMIPAELGTCYVSPAYKNMLKDFKHRGLFSTDQELISLDQLQNGPIVKTIATAEQFQDNGPIKTLLGYDPSILKLENGLQQTMDFEVYQILKGFEEVYKEKNLNAEELAKKYRIFKAELADAAIRYIIYHYEHYGRSDPFPLTQRGMKSEIFSMSIYDFLKKNNFLAIYGLLQFGYSLQGYGDTGPNSNISAFYLLMWVTPDVFLSVLTNDLKDVVIAGLDKIDVKSDWLKNSEDPLVQAFSKGWGDIWKTLKIQLCQKDGVQIKYGTNITNITRDKVN